MRYRTIVADPPWEYAGFASSPGSDGNWKKGVISTGSGYPMMPVADIERLPIADLADTDSRLFLWTTNRYLPDAFGVIGSWGFRYVQTLVWHKTGNPSPFGGSVAPNHAEFLLVARRGHPKRLTRWRSSVVDANVGDHSAKPEAFLDLVEQVSPGPRLEMFARRQRFGWDTWGNEALCHVEMGASPCNQRNTS